MAIEWVTIKESGKEIGALGFIDDRVAIVVSFFDDRDFDRDGKVGFGEKIIGFLPLVRGRGINSRALQNVINMAKYDLRIVQRDAAFTQSSHAIMLNFAASLHKEAVYTVYLSGVVRGIAATAARKLAPGGIKEFVIRKGMESAFESAIARTF